MPHASRCNFIHNLINPLFLFAYLVVAIPSLTIPFEFTQMVYEGTSRLVG
jgi:hypothetical protein